MGWPSGVDAALDTLLYRLSIFGVPIAVGVITIIALVGWQHEFPSAGQTPLEIRVLEQTGVELQPREALRQLAAQPSEAHHDTQLSEAPFWFSFTVPPAAAGEGTEVELPSRHAMNATCWDASSLAPLGSADREQASGGMRAIKAGFAVRLGTLRKPRGVLCRGTFSGPARISAVSWPASKLVQSDAKFNRNYGLLEGGLIVLSGFALLTGLVTREWLYVLFSAWLITSLRLGALSAGWDTHWLERTIPADWLFPIRKLSISAYFMLTYALFSRLFAEDLKVVDRLDLMRINRWLAIGLLVAAVVLPYSRYLPLMWAVALIAIAVCVYLLVRIIWVTRSRVAIWYGASFVMVLSTSVFEVIGAVMGIKEFLSIFNNVTAALPSSLATALAIAERMRQEREERVRAQAELRGTYEAIPIGLFTLDQEGAFLRANPALTQMLGVDPLRERREFWSEYFEPGAWERLRQAVGGGGAQDVELHGAVRRGREPRLYYVKAALTEGMIDGSLQDITERHNATEQLRYLAENDPLTGVLNRRGIEGMLEDATRQLDAGGSLAVAYLDLDRFKLINDLFGHIAGDEVLRQVCTRAKKLLADRHSIGRIGGDEFVIVFPGAPIRLATAICRGIVEAVGRSPYQIGDKAFQVKGSIGLIEITPGTPVKDAISLADRACRVAKAGHRDGLVVYERSAAVFSERERELRLIGQLSAGVAPDSLFLMMQPIMSLREPHESLNFEVLLRMREKDGTIITAGKIIAAAESNGGVAVIDRWVLSKVLAWLDSNYERLDRTRFVCVNLSGGSLNDEKFVQDAFAMLAQYGRVVDRLCVEITESVALHDLENTRRFVDRVRDYGAKVALDDFGAGYTSFSYLKELPAEVLKIDGSFVRGVNAHPANLAIVEAIVELATNLGMKTIAEWAEDRATVESLARAGVDYVQGYAISKPQEADAILAARSSASFIEDEGVAVFVRNAVAGPGAAEAYPPATRRRIDLH